MTGNYDAFFYFGKEKNAWSSFCRVFAANFQGIETTMSFG
jgi:hypothetical protein